MPVAIVVITNVLHLCDHHCLHPNLLCTVDCSFISVAALLLSALVNSSPLLLHLHLVSIVANFSGWLLCLTILASIGGDGSVGFCFPPKKQ